MNLHGLRVPTALALIVLFALVIATTHAHAQETGGFRLIGTIEGGSAFAGAVLDDGSGTQTFYRLREPLPDGSWIAKVARDSVSIKRSDGSSYALFLVQGTRPGAHRPARAASSRFPTAVPAVNPVRRAPYQPTRGVKGSSGNVAPQYREAGAARGSSGSRYRLPRRPRRSRPGNEANE